MKGFSSFLTEADDANTKQEQQPQQPKRVNDTLVTSFGRFNPMHKGHEKALKYAKELAGDKADTRFYASKSHDEKKNPLDYKTKMADAKKQYPDYAGDWDDDENVRTILDAAKKAYKDGYKNFKFVGGADRREGMENLLRKYNNNPDFYSFDNIESHSAGERDDATGNDPIANYSASNQRKYAQDDDFESYKQAVNIGDSYTEDDARATFKMLQARLAQKQESVWPVCDDTTREELYEMYRNGELYQAGDLVESLTTGLVGNVHRCGSNHLIVVTEDGVMFKSFVHDVQKV